MMSVSMLQQDRSHGQTWYEGEEQGLDPSRYLEILRKRKFYFIVPLVVVLAVGLAVAALWPPLFLSEGRILVASQQIPPDLVRPTVVATAKERIQVIEQRVMTRDTLLTIMDKYRVFADQQGSLSRTELLDLMRQNVRIQTIELDQHRRNEVTLAVKVGFMHRQPEIAMRVANELMTLFLDQDARNRTNRAMETTKFLAREVQKLEMDLASVEAKLAEAKLAEAKLKQVTTPASPEPPRQQLALLQAELAQKSGVFSGGHPEIRRLKRQIAALEKVVPAAPVPPAVQSGGGSAAIEPLENQRDAIQKHLETATNKLAAARLGESLERDQFSERLEVLEQAVRPQHPIAPNRRRLIAFAIIAAFMAGFGGVFAIETFDRTIRGSQDMLSVAGSHAIVTIPYIATRAELARKKGKTVLIVAALGTSIVAALGAIHVLYRPLDEIWTILISRLLPWIHLL